MTIKTLQEIYDSTYYTNLEGLDEYPIEVKDYILANYDLEDINVDDITYYTLEEAEDFILELYDVPESLETYVDREKMIRDLVFGGYWHLVDYKYFVVNL